MSTGYNVNNVYLFHPGQEGNVNSKCLCLILMIRPIPRDISASRKVGALVKWTFGNLTLLFFVIFYALFSNIGTDHDPIALVTYCFVGVSGDWTFSRS